MYNSTCVAFVESMWTIKNCRVFFFAGTRVRFRSISTKNCFAPPRDRETRSSFAGGRRMMTNHTRSQAAGDQSPITEKPVSSRVQEFSIPSLYYHIWTWRIANRTRNRTGTLTKQQRKNKPTIYNLTIESIKNNIKRS